MSTLNIRDLGAVGDGATLDTSAFARAATALREQGGGTILVPPGRYVTGTIMLSDDTTLHLDAGAVLLGSQRFEDYPVIDGRWEGVERPTHAGLIAAADVSRIAITGRGLIDGRGEPWWHASRGRTLSHPRPRLINFLRCTNVVIRDVTLTNSPSWTVHPVDCDNVLIDGVTILNPSHSPNTDGINPDSCSNVRIANCHIDVGDDCITLKAGASEAGAVRQPFRPCQNVTITNCTMVHGHGGVVIGSEMSGGVRNVTISNCVFEQTDRGIRIKTRRGRGGLVQDIRVSNVIMQHVGCPLVVNCYYRCGTPVDRVAVITDRAPLPVDEGTPVVRHLHLSGVTARDVTGPALAFLHGLPEQPIEHVSITDCLWQAAAEPRPEHAEPAMMHGAVRFEEGGLFAFHVRGLRVRDTQLLPRSGDRVRVEHCPDARIDQVS